MEPESEVARRGREAATALERAAREEELRTEQRKGSDLRKGKDRFEERSRSSDGKSAGGKQDLPE